MIILAVTRGRRGRRRQNKRTRGFSNTNQTNFFVSIAKERGGLQCLSFGGFWGGTGWGGGGCTIPSPPPHCGTAHYFLLPSLCHPAPYLRGCKGGTHIFFWRKFILFPSFWSTPPPLLAAAALLLAVAVGTANGKKHGWRRRRVLIRLRDSPLQATPPPPLFLIDRIFWGRREEDGGDGDRLGRRLVFSFPHRSNAWMP